MKNDPTEVDPSEMENAAKKQSIFSFLDKATQKASLTGIPYYQDCEMMIDPSIDGAFQNGKYVLQDLDRKVFTINYSDHIMMGNALKLGEEPLSPEGFLELIKTGTLEEALRYGDNFESSTSDFSIEHNTLTSRLSSIAISDADQLIDKDTNLPLSGEFTFEIRKCNDKDIEWKAVEVEPGQYGKFISNDLWDYGTTVTTSTATISDNELEFEFDNMEITRHSQERDADFDAHFHEIYVGALSYEGQRIASMYIHNSCIDDVDTLFYVTDDETTISLPCLFQRELIKAQPAIDIHWGLERTLDIYKKQFGIDSFNDQGSPVVAFVNCYNGIDAMPNQSAAAAFGNKNFGTMVFGLGGVGIEQENYGPLNPKNSRIYPLVTICTIGHEFTHLVASKLGKTGENNALDESYADIMGKMVERYSLKPHYYLSGEKEINTVSWDIAPMMDYAMPQMALRSMEDPNEYQDPKYYQGEYWDFKTQEPHTNAGVQNYWFYLLCNGGDITPEQGEPVSITPIERDSAELITFTSLMYFATTFTDYSMARKNSIVAAEMYYGAGSKELESVMKAWYAVGVGTDEWEPGLPTSIDAVYSNSSLNTVDTTRKTISNGKLVIIKNGAQYNAVGQKI